MKDTVNIGIVGAGGIAQAAHIPGYLKLEGVKLAAVYDINAQRAKQVSEKYGMKNCPTLEDMLADDTLDAVSICTWNNGHANAAILACKAGKHVLCEKPMAMTVAEAEEMKAASDANGKTFLMGMSSRFRPEAAILKEMADEGVFGDIYYARATMLRRRGTPLGWFTDVEKSGGGPVIDIGVHILDLTWYLMGRPKPVSLMAHTHYKMGDYKTKGVGRWSALDTDDLVFNVEDSAAGMIRFENGSSINFDVSWAINGEAGYNTHLYGDKAGAVLDPLEVFGEAAGYLTNNKPTFAQENHYDNEMRHFVDCIRTGKPSLTPAADGLAVQKMLCGIYESAKLGTMVTL
jgi:predicted dehydrogenase